MSRIDTWMPLYIGDYLADTRRLSTTEHGAYLLLLMEQWRRGWLPDDDAQLARIAGLRTEQWNRVGANIRCFFSAGDLPGTLRQARLHAERERAQEVSDKRAAAGSKGGSTKAKSGTSAKHGNGAKPLEMHTEVKANAKQMPKPGTPQLQSQSEIEAKASIKAPPALPEWLPLREWAEWCQHKGAKWGKGPGPSKALASIARYRAEGHDPAAVIDHSLANGYAGLFPPNRRGGAQTANKLDWLMTDPIFGDPQ